MGGHAGPPLPLRRPEEARSADDGRSSGNGGPACPPTFAQSAQLSQNFILLSQNKAIYSAKTNLLSQRKPLCAYDMTFLCPILVKCYSFKTRRTEYCLYNMKRNHVLRNQPLIEGIYLILEVFQDVSGVPQIFIHQ